MKAQEQKAKAEAQKQKKYQEKKKPSAPVEDPKKEEQPLVIEDPDGEEILQANLQIARLREELASLKVE